jgi:hypothetical protein
MLQLEEPSDEAVAASAQTDDAQARIDSYVPADWLPVGLEIEDATTEEWRDMFNRLIYHLHDLLHPNVFFLAWDDFAKARLLFQLAEEVSSSSCRCFCVTPIIA